MTPQFGIPNTGPFTDSSLPPAFGQPSYSSRDALAGIVRAALAAPSPQYNEMNLPAAFGPPPVTEDMELSTPTVFDDMETADLPAAETYGPPTEQDVDNSGFDNFTEGFSADNSMGVGRGGRASTTQSGRPGGIVGVPSQQESIRGMDFAQTTPTVSITLRDVQALAAMVDSEIGHWANQPGYDLAVAAIVDTALNRMNTPGIRGYTTGTLEGIIDAPAQFTGITRAGGWENYASRMSPEREAAAMASVAQHIAARANGLPSVVDTGTHFLNPRQSDQLALNTWARDMLTNPTLTVGRVERGDFHVHGRPPGTPPTAAFNVALAPDLAEALAANGIDINLLTRARIDDFAEQLAALPSNVRGWTPEVLAPLRAALEQQQITPPDTDIPLSPELQPPSVAPPVDVQVAPPDLPAGLPSELVDPATDARIDQQVGAPPALEAPGGFGPDAAAQISTMVGPPTAPALDPSLTLSPAQMIDAQIGPPQILGLPNVSFDVPTPSAPYAPTPLDRPATDAPAPVSFSPPSFMSPSMGDQVFAPENTRPSSPQTLSPDTGINAPAPSGWVPALQGVDQEPVSSPFFSPDAGINAFEPNYSFGPFPAEFTDFNPARDMPVETPNWQTFNPPAFNPMDPTQPGDIVVDPRTEAQRSYSQTPSFNQNTIDGQEVGRTSTSFGYTQPTGQFTTPAEISLDPYAGQNYGAFPESGQFTFAPTPAAPVEAPAAPAYSPPAPTTPAGAFPDPVDLSDVPTAPAPAPPTPQAPQVPAAIPAQPARPATPAPAPAVPDAPPLTVRGPGGGNIETPTPTAAPRSFDDIARTGSFYDIASYKGTDGLPAGVSARDAAVAAANQKGYGGWNDLGFTGGLNGPHPDLTTPAMGWAQGFYGDQNFSTAGLPSLSLDPRAGGAIQGASWGGLLAGPIGAGIGGIAGLINAANIYDSPLPGGAAAAINDWSPGGYKVDPNTPISATLSEQLGTPSWGSLPGESVPGGLSGFLAGIFGGGAPAAGGGFSWGGGWGDTAGGGRPDPGDNNR